MVGGKILNSIVIIANVPGSQLSLGVIAQSLPNFLSTGFSSLMRNVVDCKGEILADLLPVKLYWMKNIGLTAAWLRAEAHWESLSYMRYVDNYKRKYADQEFYALKRRCTGQDGNSLKCFCFVAVKKEEKNIRRSVLNSVVGTLDLSIRQFLLGETYPGEIKRPSAILASHKPYDTHKYAYVANVCVAKFARRKGIALNMLYLATDVASLAGMKQLFVHVNADNLPAQELYKKTGFKIVEAASSPLSKDQMLLMNMEL
ncbi:GCN5-related N-acetyltransferase 6, chloroplastic-like isoform X3 [Actinidia eriantha]|uniref:GCN5-related N-acetyltransferase 6, chloroplastic-like isoform X3 n=1 Tax=Actinidia eriantha TaxID=165200 RepID=UPI00258A6CFE|nr:GCN5-related N-acetyltransferase 6, chloroplastic-like isoform X3 [Actinidia eriantha]